MIRGCVGVESRFLPGGPIEPLTHLVIHLRAKVDHNIFFSGKKGIAKNEKNNFHLLQVHNHSTRKEDCRAQKSCFNFQAGHRY